MDKTRSITAVAPWLVSERRSALGLARTCGLVAIAALLGACAVQPEPLSGAEVESRIDKDLSALFAEQEPVTGPITLNEAMARAVLYNMENRVQLMEAALANRQVELASFDMLPQVLASAGIETRSNTSASSSLNVITNESDPEDVSTSLDERREVADAAVVFNILDFGVSYFNARQQGNRALVAQEQRRRVVHTIIQDVRSSYWRALAAQRLLDDVGPLMQRIVAARNDAATIRRLRLQSPLDALTYERTLLETLRQLQQLRSQLSLAKTELAALMNLPLDQSFTLADPAEQGLTVPRLGVEVAELERLALAYRPELREEGYQARIAADETRKAMARMLPGLELDAGFQYDSNSFLLNNEWYEAGLRVTWNLVSLLSGPASIRFAEAQEELVETRRQALSMAVLTQLYVAWIGYSDAVQRFETASDLMALEGRILRQRRNAAQAGRTGELPVIQAELDRLVATLRRDLAYADVQNAAGNIFLAVGADPLPETVEAANVEALSQAIGETVQGWYDGDFNVDDLSPAMAEPAMTDVPDADAEGAGNADVAETQEPKEAGAEPRA